MKFYVAAVMLVLLEAQFNSGHSLPKIKDIPEAPVLAKINYNSLPAFVRGLISTEKPNNRDPIYNPKRNIKLFEEQNKNIMATPPDRDIKVKTYGMNLTNYSGHVWNDLTNPRVSYYIGDQDITDEALNNNTIPVEDSEPDTIDAYNSFDSTDNDDLSLTTTDSEYSKENNNIVNDLDDILVVIKDDVKNDIQVHPQNSNETDGVSPGNKLIYTTDESIISDDVIELNDELAAITNSIEGTTENTLTADMNDSGNPEDKLSNNNDADIPTVTENEPDELEKNKNNNSSENNESKEKPMFNEDSTNTNECVDDLDEYISEDECPIENTSEDDGDNEEELCEESDEQIISNSNDNDLIETDKANEHEQDVEDESSTNLLNKLKIKNLVLEIIASDEFRKSMTDQTAKYFEIFMEKIDGIITSAVRTQIRSNCDGHNICEICKNMEDNDDNTRKNDESNIIESDQGNVNDLNVTKTNNKETATEPNPHEFINNELVNIKAKNNSTNITKAEKESSTKVEAKTIYGNSVNNEKVTNIFIFNFSANLKPLINEAVNENITLETSESIDTENKIDQNENSVDNRKKEKSAIDTKIPENYKSTVIPLSSESETTHTSDKTYEAINL